MKKEAVLVFLAIILFACSNNRSEYKMMENKFTWNIQKAGYNFDQSDEMGEISYEQFVQEFEKFPWLAQLDYIQKVQEGTSPTLTVEDLKSEKALWVSMLGDSSNHAYLIGYIYPKQKKGFLGLGKEKIIRWLEIHLTEDSKTIKKCFQLFFNRQHNQLENKLKTLEEYDQMEAKT